MSSHRSGIEDITFRVRDGLKLFARCYKAVHPAGRPAICLPGLTRNGRDFHDLAVFLSNGAPQPRDVYTLDYRGRGSSEWDDNWKNYTVPTEALDTLDFMASKGLHNAAVIGTSRGGMIAMSMATMQPAAVGSLVLNDIGPVIETDGLMRIAAYVGLIPLPRDWDEAVAIVKSANKRDFPHVSMEEWAVVARQFYNEKDGRPASGYDPKLKNAFSVLDGPMPTMWPQFEAVKRKPLLVLRGEKSDILSAKTVTRMHQRHPMMRSHVVAGQGHAPFLHDAPTQNEIAQFLAETDHGTLNFAPASTAQSTVLEAGNPHAANDDRPSIIDTILEASTRR